MFFHEFTGGMEYNIKLAGICVESLVRCPGDSVHIEVHIFVDLLNLTQGYLGGDRPALYRDICANKVPLMQVTKSRYLLKYLS